MQAESPNLSYQDDMSEYQPNQQEIIGYAEFIGMQLPEDADLLYIAEEGLKAPVPAPWQAFSNENEQIYYRNSLTQQVIWDHPLDEHYRKKYQEAKNAKLGIKQPAFLNKSQDPLIKAASKKAVEEQKAILDQEFKQSIKEIERNFELRKQEILQNNKKEIEQEKKKWEHKKSQEVARL